MIHTTKTRLLALLPLGVALIWTSSLVSACASDAAIRQSSNSFSETGGGYSIVSNSVLDAMNRYVSTVRVTAIFNGKRGVIFSACTGVVAHARLVLTAGHCVCQPHAGTTPEDHGTFVIDASQCSRTATITVVRYKPLTEEQQGGLTDDLRWPAELIPLTGRVRPHPDLKIRYANEADQRELFSNADLAAIILEQPLDGRFRAIPLADKQVRVTEPVTSVGYGVTRSDTVDGGARRVGTNEVASLEESGGKTFRIAKPVLIPPTFSTGEPLLIRENVSYALAGDSGGPCFRENGDTLELVGIAKTSYRIPVEFSEYTSTYFYREWIRQEIKRAQKASPLQTPD